MQLAAMCLVGIMVKIWHFLVQTGSFSFADQTDQERTLNLFTSWECFWSHNYEENSHIYVLCECIFQEEVLILSTISQNITLLYFPEICIFTRLNAPNFTSLHSFSQPCAIRMFFFVKNWFDFHSLPLFLVIYIVVKYAKINTSSNRMLIYIYIYTYIYIFTLYYESKIQLKCLPCPIGSTHHL